EPRQLVGVGWKTVLDGQFTNPQTCAWKGDAGSDGAEERTGERQARGQHHLHTKLHEQTLWPKRCDRGATERQVAATIDCSNHSGWRNPGGRYYLLGPDKSGSGSGRPD